jgi:uncharacterized protein (TIGR01777 family)
MKIIIAASNGFLGSALVRFFRKKAYTVIGIERNPKPGNRGVIRWTNEDKIKSALEGSDVLINLAGRSVDCRYNRANKREILHSRISTTEKLGDLCTACSSPPKLWINASTATIYRYALDRPMTEAHGEIGNDFSMNVAKSWERAFFESNVPNTRQVALRTSIVLGATGGAYIPLKRLAQFGLGGTMGPGNQQVSWIHIDDFCRAVDWIIKHDHLSGPINVTAPHPTSNREQMRLLRESMGVPIGLPASKGMLEVGAAIIGTETELILKSRWVVPETLLKDGFTFAFPNLQKAFEHLAKAEVR